MSKKNKKSTKRNVHANDLKREKLAAVKKQLKVQKQENKAGTSAPSPSKPKTKRKGIRLRKGISVKGIKIVDSASKRKVKQLLAAEAEMRKMEVESTAGWEEGPPSDVEDME